MKKSNGVRSDDLGDHAGKLPLPVYCSYVCSQCHSNGMLPHQKNTQSRKISLLPIFCSISSQSVFAQSWLVGLVCCHNCCLYAHKHKCFYTSSWAVEWGKCSRLLAVQIELCRLCRNVCLIRSSSLVHGLGCPIYNTFSVSETSVLLNGVVAWCWTSMH
jgi:hypothetical protein